MDETGSGIPNAAPPGAVTDFDFLVGRWRMRNRRLTSALAGTTAQEFDGECVAQKLLGGQASVDDNVLHPASGTYRASTIRTFDPEARAWSIFWIDSRYPPTSISSPVVGGFAGNRGLFFWEGGWRGRAVRTRFLWIVESPDVAHFEQAVSADGGANWEPNWQIRLERLA